MAQNIIDTKIREAYDTEANWIKYNPVLLSGQLAYSSDKYGKYKIGNGASRWSQLQYATLGWGDITEKPSTFSPSTHTHPVNQVTGLTPSAIGAAPASHIHNNYLPTSGGTVDSLNAIQYTVNNSTNIVPNARSIAANPFSRFLWHDHFAFLNNHTIKDSQIMNNNSSIWSEIDSNSLMPLFIQKENQVIYLLSKEQTARRFTIFSPTISYSGISWFEIGVTYAEPFSQCEIHIEASTDNTSWITVHKSIISTGGEPHYLKAEGISNEKYIRFTFTKKDNLASVFPICCLKALTIRKGNQGLGIELEKPYEWDTARSIYPHENTSPNLGTYSRRWNTVFASTFIGNVQGDVQGNVQGNVQGKSTSSDYLHVYDTRNENPMPNDKGFRKQAISFDFKSSSTIGNPITNGHDFAGLMSFAPWSETSGGNGYQMAFGFNASDRTTPRLAIRTADLSATSWNSWYKIYTSADKPTLAELGAAASDHSHTLVERAALADKATYINDVNDNRPISISYVNETSTSTRFPVWGDRNTMVTMSSENLRTSINAAKADHTHPTGNATTLGLTKLYTKTGTAIDGTVTQKGITEAIDSLKYLCAPIGHTHTVSQITDFTNIKAITNTQIDSLANL